MSGGLTLITDNTVTDSCISWADTCFYERVVNPSTGRIIAH